MAEPAGGLRAQAGAGAPEGDGPVPEASSQIVARNTGVQIVAEVLSRVCSLALYVVMARQLGTAGFGEFTVAFSLATLLIVLAGPGVEGLIIREVARDRRRVHALFWNSIGLEAALGIVTVGIATAVAFIGDYATAVRIAVPILGASALIEVFSKGIYATFLAYDDMRPGAASLLLQRFITAVAGIAVLLAGGGIVLVAVVFLAGAIVANAYAFRALVRRMVTPRFDVTPGGIRRVFVQSFAIGLGAVFNAVLFRVDTIILSFYKSESVVGLYGAAYRVLDSTLFITYSFVAALLPSLARQTRTSTPSIGATYETGLKVLTVALFPLGTGFALFAPAIIDVTYGDAFAGAVPALRWLGGTIAIYGFSYLGSVLLVAQDRQRIVPWVSGAAAVENIVLNVILIPTYSLVGSAAATTITEVSRAVVLGGFALTTVGRISYSRVVVGPLLACGAMAIAWALLGEALWVAGVAGAAYVAAVLAIERLLHPGDVSDILAIIRRRVPGESAEAASPG